MPKFATYCVSWSATQHSYSLSQRSEVAAEQITLTLETPAWFAWLTMNSSFAFRGQAGSYTARKEHSQRKGLYWYAYLRSAKKLHKKYLGKPAELTIERLEQIAAELHAECFHNKQPVVPEVAGSSPQEQSVTPQSAHASRTVADPLLALKLSIPRPPTRLIPRAHLIASLQNALHYPLTLITASAGFGKTTLLSSWLHQYSGSVAWISLDSGDDDPTRFWSYVFTALNTLIPDVADTALSLLHLQQAPSIETILTTLINNFSASSVERVLVLDDYHLITAQLVHKGVSFLLDHIPPTLHLVLATRVDPPLPLARFRVRNQLLEVRTSHLRFTLAESAAFLSLTTGQPFSTPEVDLLLGRTEGWIAGLQLAALSLQNAENRTRFIQDFTGSHRYVFDYLLQEVLTQQSQQVQSFLLQTSILVRLHGELCAAIIGQPGQQAVLEGLEQNNLFLQPLDDDRRWYRYHHLFADVLRQHLLQTQPELVPLLYRRASQWCEQAGLLHEAVSYALAIDDFASVAQIINSAGPQMIERGELVTLQNWLQKLPDQMIRAHLRLCLYEGWRLIINAQTAAADRLLQDYEQQHASTIEPPELLAEQFALRSTLALRGQKDIPLSIHYARKSLEYYPQESMGRALVLYNLGVASLMCDDQQGAIDAFTDSIAISQAARSTYSIAFAGQALSFILMRKGQLRRTEQLLAQLMHSPIWHTEALFAKGPLSICLGMLLCEWNKSEEAIKILREGLTQCRQADNISVMFLGHFKLARLALGQGHIASAEATLREIEPFLHTHTLSPSLRSSAAAYRAWCAFVQRNYTQVDQWLQSCALSIHAMPDHQREVEYLILARLLRGRKRSDEAQAVLSSLLGYAEAQEYTGSKIGILVQQSLTYQAQGRIDLALSSLASALVLAEPESYLRIFLDEGVVLLPLLRKLRSLRESRTAPISSRLYIDTILYNLRKGRNTETAIASDHPIDLLSERELEVLRLLVAGCSNREIASHLVIALSTVKSHVNTIFSKLNVESRTQAIARAHELHILV